MISPLKNFKGLFEKRKSNHLPSVCDAQHTTVARINNLYTNLKYISFSFFKSIFVAIKTVSRQGYYTEYRVIVLGRTSPLKSASLGFEPTSRMLYYFRLIGLLHFAHATSDHHFLHISQSLRLETLYSVVDVSPHSRKFTFG